MGFFGDLGGVIGLNKGKGETIANPYAQDQKNLIEQLKRRAAGFEPSLAEEETKQMLGKSLNDQVSAARSAPGLNPALQARIIGQAGQQNATDIVQQGTVAKLVERDANQGALQSALFGASNQEINRQAAEGQAQNARYGRLGQIAGGAGAAAVAASDENAKENIKDSNGKALDFVDHLKSKLYEYKDDSNGPGVHVGIMAQDLEKSPLGRSMVFEENGTKKVDFGKGYGALLAAVSEINDKLKDIEGKRSK